MDKVIDLIRSKAIELSKIELPNEKEADFLSEFLTCYNASIIDTYDRVSNISYVAAVLLANHIPLEFEEFMDLISKVEDVFNNPDINLCALEDYFKALKQLNDTEKLLEASPNSKGLDKATLKEYKKFNLQKLDRIVCKVGENNFYDAMASKSLIKLFKALPDPELFISFTELLIVTDYLKIECDIHIDEFNDMCNSRTATRIINREIDKIIKNAIRKYINSHDLKIYDHYENIVSRYEKIYRNIQSVAKETNRKIAHLEKLDNKLSSWSKKELFRLDRDFGKPVFDPEIEYKYLLCALNHNFSIQSGAEQENQEYNNNLITKMDILFSKYGFNFNDIYEDDQNEIIALGVEAVEDVIKQVRYSDLTFISEYSDLFARVIRFSNSRMIKIIDSCLKIKFITKEFILTNNKVLYDSELFNHFFNNVNSLLSAGVNLTNRGAQTVLLIDNNRLMTQLDILGEYKFKLSDESFSNFELFKNSDLLDYFDNFIELGYGETVIDNPRYLNNNSKDMIQRIMIANLIGLSPTNSYKKFIGSITSGNGFYIGSSEYYRFIIDYKTDYQNPICVDVLNNNPRNVISVSTKNMPIIKVLDELYMKESLYYVIDGVIISRKRVMRNLEALTKNMETMTISLHDLLFQSILYNMINNVEPEKLEQIYNTICSIDINKVKTYTFS